jgi:predicted aconitase
MFHAVGITPEAGTLEQATRSRDIPQLVVSDAELIAIRESIGSGESRLGAVSVGTPHMSAAELTRLAALAGGNQSSVPFYVNTSRSVCASVPPDTMEALTAFGATVVTDTCTYITPIMGEIEGTVMTNSAKWAYYAPGNLGVEVALGSLSECVASAIAGTVDLDAFS